MKKAVVLGATGTLGKAIVEALVKEGFYIIGSSFKNNLGENNFAQDKVKLHNLDMGSIDSIDSFFKEVAEIDNIDFFTSTIANTLTFEKFEKIDLDTFKKEFAINFFNYIYFLKKIIPKMKEDSNIIFILSEMIAKPQKNFSPYITSKFALFGLMKSLTKDLEHLKIRVNSVSPSKMNTDFLWKMNLNNKTVSVPSAIKEIQLKTRNFLSPDRVAAKIMEIVNNGSIRGKNFIIK